jgi:hypothetical protein
MKLFTIPKMKLSKLETFFTRGVVYILFPISTLRLCRCSFVSAEYVGHVFDYGVSVFIRVAYPGRSLHFVVYELIRRSSVVATSTYRPNQLYAHVAKQYSARPNHKENKPVASTLEEEMVQTRPVRLASQVDGLMLVSVSENIHNAFSL